MSLRILPAWFVLPALLLSLESSAATLDFSGGVLFYAAANGVVNGLTVSFSSGLYSIHDAGESTITLTANATAVGCAAVDANTATCPRSSIASWNVSLGDQNDVADLSAIIEPTVIRGGPGADLLLGGAGPDTFLWNPGDQSDTLDGGPGADTLQFTGANINETYTVSATANGFQLTRDVAAVTMDVRNVEALNLSTLGADDVVNTVPLPNTTQTIDGGTQTTNGDVLNYDTGGVCASEGVGSFQTLGSQVVNFTNFESVNLLNECTVFPSTLDLISGQLSYAAGSGAANALSVALHSGVYTIDDGAVPAIQLTTNATAAGCANLDLNTVTCPRSAITSWSISLGDQSDTIDGGPGADTLVFGGANINEHLGITAAPPNGFRVTRDIANVTLDVRNVEALTLSALSGDDVVSTVPLPFTTQTLDGGAQTGAGDSLVYDAGGACTTQTTTTFQSAGERGVSFSNFESVSLVNECADPIPVPALGEAMRVTLVALLGIAALGFASARRRRWL